MYSSEEHLGIPRVGPQALSTTSLTFSSASQPLKLWPKSILTNDDFNNCEKS